MIKKWLKTIWLSALLIILWQSSSPHTTHAQSSKPFSLPFNVPSGLNTWLFEQPYGNTVEAFNMGKYWYKDGQGLHFGVDFETPCQTPLVAIADGYVDWVDNGSFGAGPHNLVLRHPDLGYVSVYGHLYIKPKLAKGQAVTRGEIVALSGDPDLNCFSRPHLHLEIHSTDYRIGYDPLTLIDADWNMLYSLNPEDRVSYTKDLYHPNRWQTADTQPTTRFNDWPLNNYVDPWPPLDRLNAATATAPAFTASDISPLTSNQSVRLTAPGCCTQPWWSLDNQRQSIRYIDGPDGELAGVNEVNDRGEVSKIGDAPPAITSPDGRYTVRVGQGHTVVTRLSDKVSWQVFTQGTWPTFSPMSSQLLWQVRPTDYIAGESLPQTEIWISQVNGSAAKLVRLQSGGWVIWLDEDRLLMVETPLRSQESTLSIYTISTQKTELLAAPKFLRALTVAPGGKFLMYYLPFQQLPEQSSVYLLETRQGAVPQKLPFVGGWRWRDSHSVIYIPFGEDAASLWLYNIESGVQERLTNPATVPFHVALADWHVSPDGNRIVYVDADDGAIWLLNLSDQVPTTPTTTPTSTPESEWRMF